MADKSDRKVKPQVLKGFRDYPASEQIARERMLAKLRSASELMGFLPLQTPSLEFAESLLGSHYNSDSLAELFGFRGPDDVDMALRYEFTLSLARYVAGQPTLAMPFRRYQYGNVWRVDKPGPGRFREFMQFDIDIVGTKNLLADAEIIAAMVSVFDHLGVERYEVRFSNRKILNGLVSYAGIPAERGADVLRVIDKLEKQGRDAVLLELGPGRIDQSGDKIRGLGLESKQISSIDKFLEIAITRFDDPLATAIALLDSQEESRVGVAELKEIEGYLKNMKVDRSKSRIDLSIVRGLGYYTGPVFELTLLDLPEYGSMFSGGRYDNLVERFLNRSFPAVGSSIGIDRLLAALIALKKLETTNATSFALVTVMDRERLPDYLAMLNEIRSAGIPSEIYVGETKNIAKQFAYADKVGIPFAIVVGSTEFDAGQVTIKNLRAGKEKSSQTSDRDEWLKAESVQATIPRSNLIDWLRRHQA
jgi:histidyl-tRNA synthetase